jgi:hypothetical protein
MAKRNKLAAAVAELEEACDGGDRNAVVLACCHLGACCCEKKVFGAGPAPKGTAVETDDLKACEDACRKLMGQEPGEPAGGGQPVPVAGLLDDRPLLRQALQFALALLAQLLARQEPPAPQA